MVEKAAPASPRRRTPRRVAAAPESAREHVILLHGIWMRGITLLPLARRLRNAGYSVETIDYASVFRGVAPAVDALRERIRQRPYAYLAQEREQIAAAREALAAESPFRKTDTADD